MTNRSSVADDAVSNRSDDTAIDEARARSRRSASCRRGAAGQPRPAMHREAEVDRCRSRVEPSSRTEAAEADAEVEAEQAASPPKKAGRDDAEEPRRHPDGLVHPQGAEQSRAFDCRGPEAEDAIEGLDTLLRSGDRADRKGDGVQGRQEEDRRAEAVSGLHRRAHAHQRRHVVRGSRDVRRGRFHRRRRQADADARPRSGPHHADGRRRNQTNRRSSTSSSRRATR